MHRLHARLWAVHYGVMSPYCAGRDRRKAGGHGAHIGLKSLADGVERGPAGSVGEVTHALPERDGLGQPEVGDLGHTVAHQDLPLVLLPEVRAAADHDVGGLMAGARGAHSQECQRPSNACTLACAAGLAAGGHVGWATGAEALITRSAGSNRLFGECLPAVS